MGVNNIILETEQNTGDQLDGIDIKEIWISRTISISMMPYILGNIKLIALEGVIMDNTNNRATPIFSSISNGTELNITHTFAFFGNLSSKFPNATLYLRIKYVKIS